MRPNLLFCISALCIAGNLFAQHAPGSMLVWTNQDLFQPRVFIRNEGQFDGKGSDRARILFGTRLGDIDIYFTKNGVIYRHDQYTPEEERDWRPGHKEAGEEEEEEENYKIIPEFFHITWKDANPNLTVVAEGPATAYHTYYSATGTSVKAEAFEKIIYRNLYPGIDVEYILPEAGGLKYTLTVHPGADLAAVKMVYDDARNLGLDENGNLVVAGTWENFTDHAPVSFYADKSQAVVKYGVENKTVKFIPENYDPQKLLVIDPWVTSPGFNTINEAYDVAYDFQGNVYAYGGGIPFQLVKMDAAGNILWTFNNAIMSNNNGGGIYFGDFTVDPVMEFCFLGEGYNNTGTRIIKLDPAGAQVGTAFALNIQIGEIWRMEYDLCQNKLVIGGGNIDNTFGSANCCTIDANFTNAVYADVFATGLFQRDVALMTLDPAGDSVYFASARTLNQPNGNSADNILVKCPVPLGLSSFSVFDGYSFVEKTTVTYVGNTMSYKTNGFNGLVAGRDFIYSYDGATLLKRDKYTGALVMGIPTTGTAFATGGLAIDECENLYVGVGQTIRIYNSALTLLGNIAVAGDVYDVQINGNKLYACGSGFVQELSITPYFTVTAIANQSSASCVCNGSATVTTSCPNPAYTFSWSNGETTTTATQLCPGTHTVTVHTACNVIHTATVSIGTLPAPLITLAAQTNVSCAGGSDGSAGANASGGAGSLTFQWNPSGGTNPTANNLQAGTYVCVVSDSVGCTDSLTVVITEPPPISTSIAVSNSTCGQSNGSALLTATGGTGAYTYAWNPSGGNTASVNNLAPGNYFCLVTDANGCSHTDSALVYSSPGPTINLSTINPVSCFGNCNGSASVTSAGGTGSYSYAWTPSGGNMAAATNLCAGNYLCTVTDSTGCADSISIQITEPAVLTAMLVSSSGNNCAGDSSGTATVNGNGGTGAYSYNWSPYGGNNSSAPNLIAGSYTCTVTDSNGCIANASVAITSPPTLAVTFSTTQASCGNKNGTATANVSGGINPYLLNWNSNPSQQTATADSLDTGNYILTVTDSAGCVSQFSVFVGTLPLPVGVLSTVNASCNGDCNGNASVVVTGTGPFNYSWNTIPVQNSAAASNLCAGTYQVIFSDSAGCTDTMIAIVGEPAPLIAMASPVTGVCSGQVAQLSGSAQGGTPGYGFTWNPGGAGQSVSVSPNSPATYILTVNDANGCVAEDSVFVDVFPLPVVTFTADTLSGCPGVCVSFVNTTQNSSVSSWSFGDGNTSSLATPVNCYSATGQYDVTLTVTDNNGCVNSLTNPAYIEVYPRPVAAFTAFPQPATLMQPLITFTDQSSGATQWSWSFGDINASSSALQNPSFEYQDTGLYVVVQTVSNAYGCTDTAAMQIHIAEDYAFYAPNGFTPNGDGVNDVWRPEGIGIGEAEYQLYIFDRWGNLIFETTDWHEGWDGRVQGASAIAQQDVYVWKVQLYSRATHMRKYYTGHVSLVK
jgi:gliding motility-associated-like protein